MSDTMTSIDPRPRRSSGDRVHCTYGYTVIGCDRPENLPRLATQTDGFDVIDGEFVPGSSVSQVAHVLGMIPEVQVTQVDAPVLAPVAGVQDVGVAGVTVVDDPHGASRRQVTPTNPCDTPVVPQRHLTLIGDGEGSLSENVKDRAASSDPRVCIASDADAFLSRIMKVAQSVAPMFTVATFDGTSASRVVTFDRFVGLDVSEPLPSGVMGSTPATSRNQTVTRVHRTDFHHGGHSNTNLRKAA